MLPVLINSVEMSRAASETGCEIRQILSASADYFRGSWTYGQFWRSTINELSQLDELCSRDNWDGFGAPALQPQVFQVASRFIASIPFEIPVPEISASAQGDISFEWANGANRIVSVAVSASGEVHFASLIGYKKSFGSFPFDGSFDSQIADLIKLALG